jgi:hypothetical protein
MYMCVRACVHICVYESARARAWLVLVPVVMHARICVTDLRMYLFKLFDFYLRRL